MRRLPIFRAAEKLFFGGAFFLLAYLDYSAIVYFAMKTLIELEARRAALLKQLGRIGPLVEGSLAVSNRKCGSPKCRCATGDRHRYLMLCRKELGRSQAITVPVDLHETVRAWNAEHKRVKALLKEISGLSEQIIRGYVAAKRAAHRQEQFERVGEDADHR